MIVTIDRKFLKLSDDDKVKDVCEFVSILEHGHYLEMDPQIENAVTAVVEDKLLYHQKKIYEEANEYLHPTKKMKRYLKTLSFYAFEPKKREILFMKPSELLMENAPNEWHIYENMYRAYRDDAKYSSIFAYVLRAIKDTKMLIGEQAGGKGEIPKMIKYKEAKQFDNLYRYKVCILFDRDTSDNTCFAKDNSPIFKFLCGKEVAQVVDSDIYKLDFRNGYVWHSWYKRAIENYFPKSEYQKLGVEMTDYPDDESYDYIKFPIEDTPEWKKKHHSVKKGIYHKNMMEKIGTSMTLKDYEKNLKMFDVEGLKLSELELFLLKIAKIT